MRLRMMVKDNASTYEPDRVEQYVPRGIAMINPRGHIAHCLGYTVEDHP